MDKQQFNQLEVLEQIQYINNNLDNNSLTKLCDTLGVNRSTISKRFKAKGYTFNKELNKYINEVPTEPLKSNVRASDDTIDTNTLLNMIRALEERVLQLEVHKNNTKVLQSDSNIQFYPKNNDTVKTFRIDIDIYNRFKEYCNKNSMYKQKDILSSALEQYLNKFDTE